MVKSKRKYVGRGRKGEEKKEKNLISIQKTTKEPRTDGQWGQQNPKSLYYIGGGGAE